MLEVFLFVNCPLVVLGQLEVLELGRLELLVAGQLQLLALGLLLLLLELVLGPLVQVGQLFNLSNSTIVPSSAGPSASSAGPTRTPLHCPRRNPPR